MQEARANWPNKQNNSFALLALTLDALSHLEDVSFGLVEAIGLPRGHML